LFTALDPYVKLGERVVLPPISVLGVWSPLCEKKSRKYPLSSSFSPKSAKLSLPPSARTQFNV